jgi:uncharacterized protein
MCTYGDMRFEWDPEKNRTNQHKHGIDFEDVKRLFEQPVIEKAVERHGETRVEAFGYLQGLPVLVIYTMRGENTYRLISARRASSSEERMVLQSLRAPRRQQSKNRSQNKADHNYD